MPAVFAWKMVAIAMTASGNPIPRESGIAAIVLAVLTCVTVVVKSRLPEKYRPYVPNWSGIGLAFTMPPPNGQTIAFAMVTGAAIAFLVKKYKPLAWEKFGYPVAAGLTAGEACTGLFLAGLVIAGIDGDKRGTQLGCPFGEC